MPTAEDRLRGDEVYHFHPGDPVETRQLCPDGSGREVIVSSSVVGGMRPQIIVSKGIWREPRLRAKGRVARPGTTRAPGLGFADFEPGGRAALRILALTRESAA